jgi:hypothetical protein
MPTADMLPHLNAVWLSLHSERRDIVHGAADTSPPCSCCPGLAQQGNSARSAASKYAAAGILLLAAQRKHSLAGADGASAAAGAASSTAPEARAAAFSRLQQHIPHSYNSSESATINKLSKQASAGANGNHCRLLCCKGACLVHTQCNGVRSATHLCIFTLRRSTPTSCLVAESTRRYATVL